MRVPAVVLMASLLFGASRAPAAPVVYPDTTAHVTVTERAVTLATASTPQYGEIALYRVPIVKGAVLEDAGDRFMYHFYDPKTGLGLTINSYTLLFQRKPLPGVLPSTRYMNALEWGTDGEGNDFSWRDAIDHYDSTHEAKERAYLALGYVTHLLQDMASPDHATARTHPGNYVDQFAAGRVLMAALPDLFPRDRVGYEKLWEKMNTQWPKGTTVDKPTSLKQAFDDMGREAQAEEKKYGFLQKPDEIALGLDRLRMHSMVAVGSERGLRRRLDSTYAAWTARQLAQHDDAFWATYELNIPIIPRIPCPPTPETTPYIKVGQRLLMRAEERSAGLFQHFHDIVNPPPHVRSVDVSQGGVSMYYAEWEPVEEGGRVTQRRLRRFEDKPLKKGESAVMTITFGPRWKNKALKLCGEPMKEVHVKLGDREIFGAIVGDLDPQSPSEWRATFEPEKGGTLRIEAFDAHDHLKARTPLGDRLDADPATPARATVNGDTYGWSGYEEGADTHHSIRVEGGKEEACVRGAFSPELKKQLMWCEWRGSATVRKEGAAINLGAGGKGTSDSTYTSEDRVQVTFRGTAWPDGKRVDFGGATGTYTYSAKGERIYRADGSREPIEESDSGEVDVSGSIELEPNERGMQDFFVTVSANGKKHVQSWRDSGDA